MNHIKAFEEEATLISKLGKGAAHLVWAMGLYLDELDLQALASECLTDVPDDKKIDFIKLDRDQHRVVVAQGYHSVTPSKDSAPANKASDLNTAAAWLLSGDVTQVPEPLRVVIAEIRDALKDGEVEAIDFVYTHNVSESENVARELRTVAEHARKSLPNGSTISVSWKELGIEGLERLYQTQESSIEIREKIECPATVQFLESGPKWKAAILTLPAEWLAKLFEKHADALFSANYRGFLGISRRRKINLEIRQTAEGKPQDFWVFNNGVTLLTLKMDPLKTGTMLEGISIINGAQTTGSIGSVERTKHSLKDVRVLGRIIECADADTIGDIVRFNNTQNQIETWDLYSNSPEQQRIETEFHDLGHQYARKRNRRKPEQAIGIEEVIQPLLAFKGNHEDANRGKNTIFEREKLYRSAFENKGARHILFVFTLSRCIDRVRLELKDKFKQKTIIGMELEQLNALRNLKFKNFFLSVMGRCLEPILAAKVNLDTVAFQKNDATRSNRSIDDLVEIWKPVVTAVLSILCSQMGSDVAMRIAAADALSELTKTVGPVLYASRATLPLADLSASVSAT